MTHNYFAATVLVLLVICQGHSTAADQSTSANVPAIVPAPDEIAVRGVPAYGIHLELEQCLKDAAALLGGENGALHIRIGQAQRFYAAGSGFVLRADFTRDDVPPPMINRIVCWHTGQLIASRISVPPLSSEEPEKALAVPQARPPSQH